jgi:biotin synthase
VEEYYKEVISHCGYEDRLETIDNVRKTNVTVCLAELLAGEKPKTEQEEVSRDFELQPESVPINALVAVEGTPLEDQTPVSIWDMVRIFHN